MKKYLLFVIAALVATSCGTPSVPTIKPVLSAKEARIANLRRLHDQACSGVADAYCIRYRNELGRGKTILAFLVNGVPEPIQAIGANEPPGRLLPGKEMFVPLRGCERSASDDWNRHFCRYELVVYAYSTETLGFVAQAAGSDQLMQQFIDLPHVDDDAESCYATVIDRYDRVNDNPIAHNRNADENRPPCPQPRSSAAQVAAK